MICIDLCSCRNPEGLHKALEALYSHETHRPFRVVVLDNKQGQAGRAVAEAFKGRLDLSYHVESTPGIPIARKALIAAARQKSFEHLIMFDDDEQPLEGWLDHMVETARKTGAAIVGGGVLPRFDVMPLPPVTEADFTKLSPTYLEGKLAVDSTANILISSTFLEVWDELLFDPRCQYSGGSDSELLRRVSARGYLHAFAENALVIEDIRETRCHKAWLLKRNYRNGNVLGRVTLFHQGRMAALKKVLPCAVTLWIRGVSRRDVIPEKSTYRARTAPALAACSLLCVARSFRNTPLHPTADQPDENTMHPLTLLREQADLFIAARHPKSGAPAGCNGPHLDPETPIRNSGHWLLLLARLWVLTGSGRYRNAALDMADFLMAVPSLSQEKLPKLRDKARRDQANGGISAGWLIEALALSGQILERDDLIDMARALSRWFAFDKNAAPWCVREPDGNLTAIDTTLNHQFWFAMACCLIPDPDPALEEELRAFLRGLNTHLRHVDDDLLAHAVRSPALSKAGFVERLLPFFSEHGSYPSTPALQNKVTRKLSRIQTLYHERETGYLVFNMLGLARILETKYSDLLDRSIVEWSFARLPDSEFRARFDDSKWSFPYDPPGFEYPRLCETLGETTDLRTLGRDLYTLQLRKCYDAESHSLMNGNADPATMTARLYTLSLCSKETLDQISPEPEATV